jgi:hypothetical protein
MGSGFFESSTGNEPPSVLSGIVRSLHEAELLTQRAETDIIVDPGSCQAIADAAEAIARKGWTIRAAAIPEFLGGYRTLHAKFLFSATYTLRSKRCLDPWVYLGSGNLTREGFTANLPVGNLEAGVLFTPETLTWAEGPPASQVGSLLPISWDEGTIRQPEDLTGGTGMEELPPAFFAPPVSLLLWRKQGNRAFLDAPESSEPVEKYEVYSLTGCCCHECMPGVFAWKDAGLTPDEVEIRWREMRARVPVMDEYGRIGASAMQPLRALSEAWDMLAEFPACPEKDDPDPTPGPPDGGNPADPDSRRTAGSPASYPVRSMMELLEHIAEKQSGIKDMDWALWCSRLAMILVAAGDCPEAIQFRTWKMNPLAPLKEACFVPSFAEGGGCREKYLDALRKAEQAWKVDGYTGLGGDETRKGTTQG